MILADHRISPTPPTLGAAERSLLDSTGGRSVVWCGRAATALYWAYRMVKLLAKTDCPEIIVPAISCATPAVCVPQAGCRVRFADVDPSTGMPTLATIRERWTPATRAVVFIHLYGQTGDLTELAAWCHEQGLLLIEDVAQAQGSRLPNGNPAGGVGDIGIYSFNRTKMLECGGGAMVVRTERVERAWQELAEQPQIEEIDTESFRELSLSQRNLYHSLVTLRKMVRLRKIRAAGSVVTAFTSVEDAYSGLTVRSLENPSVLADAWTGLDVVISERSAKAEIYSSKLAGGPWKLLDGWRTSGVCWRYALLFDFPEHATELTEAVRRDGFYVSNLYWPLNDLMRPADECPDAEEFARRVLNLWVDHTVDRDWVAACAESLQRNAARIGLHAR